MTLGNILGGIVLAGLIWRQIIRIRERTEVSGPRILLLLSITLTLQLISGAWASANYTGSACPQIFSCTYTENISANIVKSFNVFRHLNLDEQSYLVLDVSSSIVQLSHRVIAVILLLIILVGLWTVKARHPELLKPMYIVTGVFIAEFALGVFNVLADMPLWTNTLHNLLAVGLLFATINLTTQIHFNKK